jgi:hypothetical protein
MLFRMFVLVAALLVSALPSLAAKVEIIISKPSQKMTVYVNGVQEYFWPISTGAPGYDTPSGNFKPFRLEKDHKSTEWDDAPMPNSIFFTARGHAIHGSFSRRIGVRASHGCVRLSPQNAITLFNLVSANGLGNTRVVVKGGFFDSMFQSNIGTRPSPIVAGSTIIGSATTKVKTKPQNNSWVGWGAPPKKRLVVKKIPKKKPLVVTSN